MSSVRERAVLRLTVAGRRVISGAAGKCELEGRSGSPHPRRAGRCRLQIQYRGTDARHTDNSPWGARLYLASSPYDPLLIAAAKITGLTHRTKVVTYVFDHHPVAIEHKPLLRRRLIDLYSRSGILALRSLDGILLLNRKAYARLCLKHLPSFVSRAGIATTPSAAIVKLRGSSRRRSLKEFRRGGVSN